MSTGRRHRTERVRNLLGQEVLYLLLGGFVLATIVLAVLLAHKPTAREHAELLSKYEKCLKQCDAVLPSPPPLPKPANVHVDPPRPRRADQPPIIRMADADGYRFPSGSAAISDTFVARIRDTIVRQIVALAGTYEVDTIEVVGHTDAVPVQGRATTLDAQLLNFVSGHSLTPPTAADNVGLGMTRAAAVARVLWSDDRLRHLNIVTMSAGQTVLPDGISAHGRGQSAADEDRRRIEIRLRKNR